MRKLVPLLLLLAACDRPSTGGGNPPAPPPAGPTTTQPPPQTVQKVAWATLSEIKYEQRKPLPEQVVALDGKRIEIAGFIYKGSGNVRDIKEFILMRDAGTCCYGPQAQYPHFIMVRVVDGKGVNFTRDPIVVVGTLRVGEKWDGDYLDWIYELEAVEYRRL